jgi:hypothetical protein
MKRAVLAPAVLAAAACLSTPIRAEEGWVPARAVETLRQAAGNLPRVLEAPPPAREMNPFVAEIRRRFRSAKPLDPEKNAKFVFTVVSGRWSCRLFFANTGENLRSLSTDYVFSRFDNLVVRSIGSVTWHHAITAGGLVDASGTWIRLVPSSAREGVWDMIMEQTTSSGWAEGFPASIAEPGERALTYSVCVQAGP